MVELMPKKWLNKHEKKWYQNAKQMQKQLPTKIQAWNPACFLHVFFCIFFAFFWGHFLGMSSTMNSCMSWIGVSTRFSLHPQFRFLGKGQVVGGRCHRLAFQIPDSFWNWFRKKAPKKNECKKNANKTQKRIFQCAAGKKSHNTISTHIKDPVWTFSPFAHLSRVQTTSCLHATWPASRSSLSFFTEASSAVIRASPTKGRTAPVLSKQKPLYLDIRFYLVSLVIPINLIFSLHRLLLGQIPLSLKQTSSSWRERRSCANSPAQSLMLQEIQLG